MKKLLSMALLSSVVSLWCLTTPSEAAPKYTGTEGCKCHKTEIEEWQTSKHAQAFHELTVPEDKKDAKKRQRLFSKLNEKLKDNEKLDPEKDYSTEKRCLPCHVIGYDERGGFEDIKSTPDKAGVGCEMCHGPGSDYRVLHKDKDMTFTQAEAKAAGQVYSSQDEKVCRKCHDNKDSPMRSDVDEKYKFDWKEFLSLEKTYHKVYPLKGKH